MDTTTDLSRVIGARLHEHRISRKWTLDHLAALAGISRRMLINVEQGDANPSVNTLLRLSDALGIGLPSLVEPPDAAALKVTRGGDGAALWTSEAGGRGVLVAGTEPPDVVELWDWTLVAGDRHVSEAHVPGTRELIQVREGRLCVGVDDQKVVLDVGDAVTFSGAVPHSYSHDGDRPTRFTLAVYEPGVGTSTRSDVSHG
jgi:transcriptional regulator with XRE-family HTH domain